VSPARRFLRRLPGARRLAARLRHWAALRQAPPLAAALHRTLLRREPTPEETARWTTALAAGPAVAPLVKGLAAEAAERDAADLVVALHRALLRRAPTPEEAARWAATHASGMPPAVLAWQLVTEQLGMVPRYVPPGHFFSPVTDPAELRAREAEIFAEEDPAGLPGIALNEAGQFAMLDRLARHAPTPPFRAEAVPGLRFRYENDAYSYGDATVLACMILEHRPRRIIEIGSGWSSACILDTVDHMAGAAVELTFIEPYPARLHSLLREGDSSRAAIHALPVQAVDLGLFDALAPGDILFIDSTHIVKTGSDVVHELFRVLPRLAPGVLVHFHDVFFPFEYPRAWAIGENRSWNELYALRAFLANNREYEILLFNDFLAKRHRARLAAALPQAMANPGGALWLRKVRTPD
jgi:predicted O-methyltransferase YrrM